VRYREVSSVAEVSRDIAVVMDFIGVRHTRTLGNL
jgi:hypothetical protein